MPNAPLRTVIHRMRRAVNPVGGLSDATLLERFARARDEAAFEVLLWRHGSLVLSVCRRLLPEHDAEDVFQATFFILARKAGSIGKRESLSSWLYKVAYRLALRARSQVDRGVSRQLHGDVAAPEETRELEWREVRPVLDEEIFRLPEKYRTPFILCYLDGKTNEEAAQQLGWTKGTLATRLSWARERLRQRLTRRGMDMVTGASIALLARDAATAVPAQLVAATLTAAPAFASGKVFAGATAALAESALRTFLLAKVGTAVALFVITCGFISGTSLLVHRVRETKTVEALPPDTVRVEPVGPGKAARPSINHIAAQLTTSADPMKEDREKENGEKEEKKGRIVNGGRREREHEKEHEKEHKKDHDKAKIKEGGERREKGREREDGREEEDRKANKGGPPAKKTGNPISANFPEQHETGHPPPARRAAKR